MALKPPQTSLIGLHGGAERLGDRPGPAAGHEGDLHRRLDQKLVVPVHPLVQHDRGALHLDAAR